MKKLFPLMFAFAVIGFAGCQKEAAPPPAAAPVKQAPAAPVAQDPNAVNPSELEGAAPAPAAAPVAPAAPQGK